MSMRLYSTTDGIAREDGPGELAFLELDVPDLGELLRVGSLDEARTARVRKHLALQECGLMAPVPRPGKVPIVGLNYQSHLDEVVGAMGIQPSDLPTEPNVHLTAGSAVVGTGAPILLPAFAPSAVDYEGEIAVVIGRRATSVDERHAWSHVAGLTVANDVSARDIQRRAMSGDLTVSMGLAKSFDTFKPLGPCLVTADEFGPRLDLAIRTTVNGELRQDATTGEFLHQIPELIAFASRLFTLEPGDVLLTGSPQGVGLFSNRFLAAGDVVEVSVDRIGTLTNSVEAS
ncbi:MULTISPECIES: fumarylacetoacetate hydrolase family protein [unclassified Mycobacterium]|uniref:fumarylacetoacetate hydrolase family protein n=1 Tax=unclassified Mycobacterium TaxID=2642494 RepID=UPI0025708C86|nr:MULTISPECIES: fumarylacetoacetate hydrolase family protein [unclassified Mycobacterium]